MKKHNISHIIFFIIWLLMVVAASFHIGYSVGFKKAGDKCIVTLKNIEIEVERIKNDETNKT